jgi:hypothetical protein
MYLDQDIKPVEEPAPMGQRTAGRPPFQPTAEQRNTVKVLVSNGNAERFIAQLVAIDRMTLRKHFREELRSGREQVVAAVGAAVVRAALSVNFLAAKYCLSTHCGTEWRERHEINATTTYESQLATMSDEEKTEMIDAIIRRRALAEEARREKLPPLHGSLH